MTEAIVDFLRARLDEDQQAAYEAAQASGRTGYKDGVLIEPQPRWGKELAADGENWNASYHQIKRKRQQPEESSAVIAEAAGFGGSPVARHIARHDPAHVLRDIAAKRAIVDAHDRVWLTTNWRWVNLGSHTEKMPFPICKSCTPPTQFPEQSWPCATLRHLATVYEQHPEYKETWRP